MSFYILCLYLVRLYPWFEFSLFGVNIFATIIKFCIVIHFFFDASQTRNLNRSIGTDIISSVDPKVVRVTLALLVSIGNANFSLFLLQMVSEFECLSKPQTGPAKGICPGKHF